MEYSRLEEQNKPHNIMGSSDDTKWSSGGVSLPEIEARISGESVLIKILCEKRKGVLVRILDEVEKMNMCVVSTSLTPFGDFTLDNIIVNAEVITTF